VKKLPQTKDSCLKAGETTLVRYEVKSRSWRGVLNTTVCDKVCVSDWSSVILLLPLLLLAIDSK
jgi:hypothetical protein